MKTNLFPILVFLSLHTHGYGGNFSLTKQLGNLSLHWRDNCIRTYDFHEEISQSIQKDDSLFINQVIEHKKWQGKQVGFSRAHLEDALRFKHYLLAKVMLSVGGTEAEQYAIHNDNPLMAAIGQFNAATDKKDQQDISFLIGDLLRKKKEYSDNLLAKISGSFTQDDSFNYVIRHIPDLKSQLEQYAQNNIYTPEGCGFVVRYAKHKQDVARDLFKKTPPSPLRDAMLKSCKKELSDELPSMSYQDKKIYVDGDYDALRRIMVGADANGMMIDIISHPQRLQDSTVKNCALEYASQANNIIEVLDLLLPQYEALGCNKGDIDSRSSEKYSVDMPAIDLSCDIELIEMVRGIPLAQEDHLAIQGMVQEALEKEKYRTVEAIFMVCPSLKHGDTEELKPLLEEIHKKYEILRNSLLQHNKSKEFMVKSLSESAEKAINRESFFDRILDSVMDEDDQNLMQAAWGSPLVLQATLKHLDALINQYQQQNERSHSCPVCLEPFEALNRMAISSCSHNHLMCAACFNDPNLNACPLCRDQSKTKEKLLVCQQCTSPNNPRFVYCETCESVGVICQECTQVPCCNGAMLHSDEIRPINAHKAAIIKNLVQRRDEEITQVREMGLRRLSEYDKSFMHDLKSLHTDSQRLWQSMESLERKIKSTESLHALGAVSRLERASYDGQIDTYNKMVVQYNAIGANIKKLREKFTLTVAQLRISTDDTCKELENKYAEKINSARLMPPLKK